VETYLPHVWFFVLAGILLLFTVLAGADLGLGIVSLLVKRSRRAELIDDIGPQWYANETWLVIAGAMLFGAFPHAFGLILSSLYVPAMMLVFGLMLRAASAEFRHHASSEHSWDLVFGAGCLAAALGEGFLLAGLLTNPGAVSLPGIGAWHWLNPVSALMAVATAAACVMLGTSRVVSRSTPQRMPEMLRFQRYGILLTAAPFVLLVLLLLMAPSAYHRVWSVGYRVVLVPLFIGFTLLCLAAAWFGSRRPTPRRGPYLWSIAGLVGVSGVLLALVYPSVIPFSHTISEVSSPRSTQVAMLFGVGIMLPVVIFYNLYVARVFSRPGRENPASR
jgi:cytochrome d ubiquinol oxidase subunit II